MPLCIIFTVIVIGAFAFCYVPAFVCVMVTAKLGPSQVPDGLRSAAVVMIVINSALNPIIYTIRSNEFKNAFKKIFRGSYNASGNARTAVTHLGPTCPTTWAGQSDLPSFLGEPAVIEIPAEPHTPGSDSVVTGF